MRVVKKLIPIEYSAEELLAASRPATSMAEEDLEETATARAGAAAAASKAAAAAAAAVTARKRLVAQSSSVPVSDDSAVLSKTVDWDTYAQNSLMAPRVLAWVKGKVKILLGEDEPSLVELIGDKLLKARPTSGALIKDLESMLEDEAKPFVLELWRELLKETGQ